jgi:hypothetical protein
VPEGRSSEPLTDKQTAKEIQQALDSKGYDVGPIDGIPGERTESAIRMYQQRHGLVVDGHLSQSLLRHLTTPTSTKSQNTTTYRNEALGFQVTYFNDWATVRPVSPKVKWKIASNNGAGPDVLTVSVARFTGDQTEFMTSLHSMSDSAYVKGIRKRFPGAKVTERKDTYLGSFPAYATTLTYPVKNLDFEAEGVTVQIICVRQTKLYVVQLETFTPFFEESYPVFVATLASFTFLL